MASDLSLQQFKSQVLEDYRVAHTGQELRRLASVEADCHYVTDKCDVAQVALARFVGPQDSYIQTGVDLTMALASKQITPSVFFRSIFASAYDAYSRGLVSRLSVAVGKALALASTPRAASDERPVVICTLGGDFSADGEFFESVCFASARSLPLSIVLWNNAGSYTNGNLIRQLSGFGTVSKSRKTLCVESVKSDDYAALCSVMSQQVAKSRSGVTTLTFVDGVDNSVAHFRDWLVRMQIVSAQQVAEVEEASRLQVERDRRATYFASLVSDTPVRRPRKSLMDLSQPLANARVLLMPLDRMPGIVGKSIGASLSGVVPLAEVVAEDMSGASRAVLAEYSDSPFVFRTTDLLVGQILSSLPKNVVVWTPFSKSQTLMCYGTLFASKNRAVVVESEDQAGLPGVSSPNPLVEGGASQLAQGLDITIVSYGVATQTALDATGMLQSRSVSVDLFHLHTIRPVDSNGVVAESVRRTKRLLVVDADPSGMAADALLASLMSRGDVARRLMASPRSISPRSFAHPVEPQEVCRVVSEMMSPA